MLDIVGYIVTTDALTYQKEIARQIVEQEGDYLLALKGNHPHLEEDVSALFAFQEGLGVDGIPLYQARSVERNRTRLETHACTVIDLADLGGTWSDVQEVWSGLSSLVRIQSRREYQGKVSVEVRHYLCSLSVDAPHLLGVARSHWGIEKSVHWVLDVGFNEDTCRIRCDHAPENMATLRHLALSVLRREKTVMLGVKNKRLKASRNENF